MQKSPAPTLGCADNRALNVVGNDGAKLYGKQQQLQVLSEIRKNTHEAFRLVRRSGDVIEVQVVSFDGRGGARQIQSFSFGARHGAKVVALLEPLKRIFEGGA